MENKGNVKITGPITITDDKLGTLTISNNDLDVGQNVEKTFTYILSNDDIKANSVTNTASATGKYNGNDVTSNEASATVTKVNTSSVPEFPSLTLPVASIIGIMFVLGRRKKE